MKTLFRKSHLAAMLALVAFSLGAQLSIAHAQGSLTPPDAPAPTMKTLQQVEPRTPISRLPLTITNAGSYYLTTNLSGGLGGGITIAASGVTLDLMGFELATGIGSGVFVSGSRSDICIRNGTVRGWAGWGVQAQDESGLARDYAVNCIFEDLRVSRNGFTTNHGGFLIGRSSLIRGCVVSGNTGPGIESDYASTVSNCAVSDNGKGGILVGTGSIVSGCTAFFNTGDGISGIGSTISGCTAYRNTRDGIVASTGSTVSGCTAYANADDGISTGGLGGPFDAGSTVVGCTARDNGNDGIQVGYYGLVRENHCSNNGQNGSGSGIHIAGSLNRIDSNHVIKNRSNGIDAGGFGNLIVRNSAAQNDRNDYDLGAGNRVGEITSPANAGLGTAHPWANFSF